jgi:serine phosphatase RsbU (regulator of sigma subunit)
VTFAVVVPQSRRCGCRNFVSWSWTHSWYKYDTDKIESLEAQGIPLGMIAGISYEKAEVRRMAAGDMIVLVTDGFYEWENPHGEEFGVGRLETTIRQARDSSAAEIIAKLRAAVESFCQGTEQKDDLTAVVLKRSMSDKL